MPSHRPYRRCARGFAPWRADTARPARTICIATSVDCLCRVVTTETRRSPRFPDEPQYVRAAAPATPPDRITAGQLRGARCCLPLNKRRRLRTSIGYRGSMTWLARALCTLRSAARATPRNTRLRPVASLCRTGLSPVRFVPGGFSSSCVLHESHPPPQGLPWRTYPSYTQGELAVAVVVEDVGVVVALRVERALLLFLR